MVLPGMQVASASTSTEREAAADVRGHDFTLISAFFTMPHAVFESSRGDTLTGGGAGRQRPPISPSYTPVQPPQ